MKLYKYISDNNFDAVIVNILNNNLLKFTQPKDFNDIFEMKPHIKGLAGKDYIDSFHNNNFYKILSEEYVNRPTINENISYFDFINYAKTKQSNVLKNFQNISLDNTITDRIKEHLYNGINDNFGILSLTTKKNEELMWAHYANSHKGIIIEFDSKSTFFNQKIDKKAFLGNLKKINYTDNRPSDYLNMFDELRVFLTKSLKWEYENEYRMFMPIKMASCMENDIYLFKFPSSMIKAIYIGYKTSETNKKNILKMIDNYSYLRHISIFETFISETDYKLEFKKIK